MTAEEFVLVPKEKYLTNSDSRTKIIQNSSNTASKALNLSLLQRIPKTVTKLDENDGQPKTNKNQTILSQLKIMPKPKSDRAQEIYNKIMQSNSISISDDNTILVDNQGTDIDLIQFLYDLQQPTKKIGKYRDIIERLNVSPSLVMNNEAKRILAQENNVPTSSNSNQSQLENLDDDEFYDEVEATQTPKTSKRKFAAKRRKWKTFNT